MDGIGCGFILNELFYCSGSGNGCVAKGSGSGDGCGKGGSVDYGIHYEIVNDTTVKSLNDR